MRRSLPILLLSLLLIPFGIKGQESLTSIPLSEFADRRAGLTAVVGDGWILTMGSASPPQDYIPFHQNSPFRYLTGFTEPDAALLLRAEGGRVAWETIFVLPRDPATETWEGYRIGPDHVEERIGVPGRSTHEMAHVVDSILDVDGVERLHVVGAYDPGATVRNDVTQRIEGLLGGRNGVEVTSANTHVNVLRGVKSEAEVELLRRSIDITAEAHRAVGRVIRPGRNEFEVQALLEYIFRRNGSERPAFASIVGSGPNSTILHYNANDRFMEDGEVVVIDVGASYGGYAADITRTYPVNGRFTDAQREIYQLVLDAQAAAEQLAAPGVTVGQLNQAANRVLAEGLTELGLIQAPDATFEDELGRQVPQIRLFYMHSLGHGIGLDVHDPWPSTLEPGTTFTIEPGIYVRPNLFDEVIPDTEANRGMMTAIRPAFERYVDIGVRIEDDYLVTEDGPEWLSPAPRAIEAVESLMSESIELAGERRDEWVEWYREMR